jgi:SAM-dependent methyltransferase
VFEPNVEKVLEMIKPSDVVLDIGGWACPFNRANYVLDAEAYETRGFYKTFGGPASQGGAVEHFTRDTWIVRDICDHAPYPFADKSFDWVICSQTLEDLRDPLFVCSEMRRIGKRGYIEVPSRQAESSRGWEHRRIAGLTHHRWLIDIDQSKQDIRFLMKLHRIHAHWRLSLPPAYLRSLSTAERVQWLFWQDTFTYGETTIHGLDRQEAELERFVASVRPYPAWRLAASALARRLAAVGVRIGARLGVAGH